MIYLLYTNACIEYLRNRNSAVIARISATPVSDICLSSVVTAELYHGAHRSQQAQSNLIKVDLSAAGL
jgi:tRNA(fMet)-specific endonuclease VapC